VLHAIYEKSDASREEVSTALDLFWDLIEKIDRSPPARTIDGLRVKIEAAVLARRTEDESGLYDVDGSACDRLERIRQDIAAMAAAAR
jgi:hypothetical protein